MFFFLVDAPHLVAVLAVFSFCLHAKLLSHMPLPVCLCLTGLFFHCEAGTVRRVWGCGQTGEKSYLDGLFFVTIVALSGFSRGYTGLEGGWNPRTRRLANPAASRQGDSDLMR